MEKRDVGLYRDLWTNTRSISHANNLAKSPAICPNAYCRKNLASIEVVKTIRRFQKLGPVRKAARGGRTSKSPTAGTIAPDCVFGLRCKSQQEYCRGVEHCRCWQNDILHQIVFWS